MEHPQFSAAEPEHVGRSRFEGLAPAQMKKKNSELT